jgi:drug/metabolite transporter (DMT)-like permease
MSMIASVRRLSTSTLFVGVVCVLIATLGLSLKAIFIKLAYQAEPDIDAVSVLVIRFVLALPFFILLLLYAQRDGKQVEFNRSHMVTYLILGAVGFYVSAILDFSALTYIPAGLERLILFLYPTFVVLISLVIRPHEVSRNIIIALMTSYAGLIVVFIDQSFVMNSQMVKGSLLVLGAAIAFAAYTVASVNPIKEHGSIRFTAYAMFAASGATLAHALGAHGIAVFDHSFKVYMIILPMAVVSTVMPLILMAEGVKRIGASSSSIIATSGPVITITLAVIILGESLGMMQALGAAMIITGVFFVSRK